jgi:hypothetical protein
VPDQWSAQYPRGILRPSFVEEAHIHALASSSPDAAGAEALFLNACTAKWRDVHDNHVRYTEDRPPRAGHGFCET